MMKWSLSIARFLFRSVDSTFAFFFSEFCWKICWVRKRCRSSFGKDITRSFNAFSASKLAICIAKVNRNPSFYHFRTKPNQIKAKNITFVSSLQILHILLYYSVADAISNPIDFSYVCTRSRAPTYNSNFSRVWNQLETSIWPIKRYNFKIYSRTIFLYSAVSFSTLLLHWCNLYLNDLDWCFRLIASKCVVLLYI